MRLLAIDPGNVLSAYVVYDGESILDKGKINNCDLLYRKIPEYDHVAIEMIASYGMAVGETVFETCLWAGRFIEHFAFSKKIDHTLIYRKDVKMCLCYTMKAKDGNIRQALLDMFPAYGGGKTPQIGTKKLPGPLYGMANDMWAALGVAVTWFEEHYEE